MLGTDERIERLSSIQWQKCSHAEMPMLRGQIDVCKEDLLWHPSGT